MKFKLMIETYSKAMLILYYKQRFPLKTFIKTEHQVTNENFMQNISYYAKLGIRLHAPSSNS